MPRKEVSNRLEEVDENFRSKKGDLSLEWIDAFDRRLALRGLAWPAENRKKKSFRRLPDRAAGAFSTHIQYLSHCTAGVFLSFFTDSPDLSVRLTVGDLERMDHMAPTGSAGAELYFRENSRWYVAGVARPSATEKTFTSVLLKGVSPHRREYRLYLPLYIKVERAEIGLAPGAKIEPAFAAPKTRPIFFYGTSITQGGCANTAGSDFVSMLGRILDTEVINFGFSGNGKGEPEMAKLISEIKAEIFVLDYVGNVDAERLQKTLPDFVSILRAKHPQTPIVLVGNVPFDKSLLDEKSRDDLDRKRDILMEFYLAVKNAGDANLHFIDGHGLLPIGESGIYVDGVHPTSSGFTVMAERLAPQLGRILLWNRRRKRSA